MRCIINSCTDPYFNLAAEEHLLKNFTDDIFMLWRNDNSIIIGKYQNTAAEINIDFVKEHHIKVVRRQTGGGAVFHDLGNINYTFIAPKGSGDFRTFSKPILQVLNSLDVPAKFEGRNDLTINGQKFSGNAQCVYQNRILHHGTLLFASEMANLTAALKVNPLKFKDKAVKSVRKRVTNISEHLPSPMSVTEFMETVTQYITTHLPDVQLYNFSEDDLLIINKLKNEKYATWDWNFGTSPHFDYSKQMRTAGGNIEVTLSVTKGRITQFKIYGDFFSQKGIEDFETRFIGQEYEEENLRKLLSSINLSEYLSNVSVDEMVEVMLR